MRILWLGLLAACLAPGISFGDVTREPVPDEYRLMTVRGDFEHDQDMGRVLSQKSAFAPDAVVFDSLGGNVYAAMDLGRFLRIDGIATFQTRSLESASACYQSLTGWLSISLKGSLPGAETEAVFERPKGQGAVPADAFATCKNTNQTKVCCE